MSNPSPAEPTVILILDDSAEDREVFRRLLLSDPKQNYVIHERAGIEDAVENCLEFQPDCILLDYSLADGTGIDFLKMLPAIGGTTAFPVVMLTGSGNEDVVTEAFKAGAQDYIAKARINAELLQRAVTGAIYKARTERQLAEHRRELERLYQEAQASNARKDQFLAALSHELRTPLSPILTTVSSTDPTSLSSEELLEFFAMVRRNLKLEVRLIDDLLDVTRIGQGKLQLNLQPVDVHEVLRHAGETCQDEITAKGLKLSAEFRATFATVQADAVRLQQVFWNLLKNAGKFTPEGGELTVITRNPSSVQIEVEIRDTGMGIEPDALARIFDAFEQEHASVTRQYGGIGLGLAIARGVTDAHGGSLRASSAGRGKGASFFVSLPLSEQVQPIAAPDVLQPEMHLGSVSRCLVLLVEDHLDSARILTRTMQRNGYRVVTAASVAEALEVATRDEVHLVISDIGLPDGSGLDLMRQLRRKRHIPGIALSGFGMEDDLARSYAAGFQEHLTKPVNWSQLEAALVRLLAPEPCAQG
ncbi:response regulator [Verrucomicrobiota bacterium sgz303538]